MTDMKNLSLYDYDPRSQLVTGTTEVARAKYRAIDAHNHLGSLVKEDPESIADYVRRMDSCGIQAIVDLDGCWGEELDLHFEKLKRPYPDRFHIFARLDWSRIDEPDFARQMIEHLKRGVDRGVRGLKVLKRLGLEVKTEDGEYLPVDAPRLDPIWECCGKLGIPVLIHTSDPSAFFTPLDEKNERLEELIDHPDWMFDSPEYYGKPELLEQRNRVIARHPETIFIAAHVGNLPEDLKQVSSWLDSYPNMYVDLSARLSELGRQPYSARRFITGYADRILFGTDGNAMGQSIVEMYRLHWRFLETDDEYFDIARSHKFQGRWRVHGLFLPDDVLRRVYQGNALRLIPGAGITI